MPTQWSEAEQVPLGYIAPPRPQARNSKASLCEAAQCSHWVVRRSVAEVARSAGGRDMLRQRRSIKLKGTFRAPARGAFALGGLFSVSASLFAAAFALKCRAVQAWQEHFLNSGPWPPPTFAALRQRGDLIIAQTPGVRFPKGRGRDPSLLVVSRGKDL